MQLTEGGLYHIYNTGIDKQTIFSSPDNYIYFLKKVRKYLLPVCDILCYCLVSNHFHFLIHANQKSVIPTKAGALEMQLVSASFKHILSSYTKAYNKMYRRTGSLFVQNTHCKDVSATANNSRVGVICFNYIHQCPLVIGTVGKIEDWQYSSFKDYIGLRNGTLCNKQKAIELLRLVEDEIYREAYNILDKDVIRNLLFN
ncbi:MAG: transposase [Segetibacter sp.]|nr:transposase [Segetibacter sp.]